MGIFDYYNKWGKNGMKTTRTSRYYKKIVLVIQHG